MTLLLETRVFLRWLDDGRNFVYISAAVAWEISIKRAMGKLDAPDDLEAAMTVNRFLPLPLPLPLPVTIPHALAAQALPDVHRDPIDRLLIAQAKYEGFHLVSRDLNVPLYDVPHIIS